MNGVSALISFDSFIMEPGIPIYQQLLRFIKRGVAGGTIGDGDELPSRRVLSARLGVNPNTVQKAYRLLEEEGLISSRSGAKSFMQLDGDKVAGVRAELMENEAGAFISALRQAGLTRRDAHGLIDRLWGREEEE